MITAIIAVVLMVIVAAFACLVFLAKASIMLLADERRRLADAIFDKINAERNSLADLRISLDDKAEIRARIRAMEDVMRLVGKR